MLHLIGLAFIGALLVLLLYTLRNILALPFQLVFQLLGAVNPKEASRGLVGIVGTLFYLFLAGAFLIWSVPMFEEPFKLIFGNIMWLLARVPDVIVWALGCWTSKGC